eukprot:351229-Chlamydomonas_euryale.AAC.3
MQLDSQTSASRAYDACAATNKRVAYRNVGIDHGMHHNATMASWQLPHQAQATTERALLSRQGFYICTHLSCKAWHCSLHLKSLANTLYRSSMFSLQSRTVVVKGGGDGSGRF